MPELPEVEMYRRFLDRHGAGRRLRRVSVRDARPLRGQPVSAFRKAAGRRLGGTRRHGKYLFAEVRGAGWLLFHFGMTGSFERFGRGREPRTAAVVASLVFWDGGGIAFLDPRKLGRFGLVDDPGRFVRRRGLGVDAMDLDRLRLEELVKRRRGSVKALLMDQSAMAGVGNLYADEILYQSGIHPRASVSLLSGRRWDRFFQAMQTVLGTAIARGSGADRLPPSFLLRHRDGDNRCPGCGAALRKTTVAGRTSVFCPRHQRQPRMVHGHS
jgi:formamidopyrimidine-DNA glycosylase